MTDRTFWQYDAAFPLRVDVTLIDALFSTLSVNASIGRSIQDLWGSWLVQQNEFACGLEDASYLAHGLRIVATVTEMMEGSECENTVKLRICERDVADVEGPFLVD